MVISSRTWYLRYLLLFTATFSVGTRFIISTLTNPTAIHPLRYFTVQSNLMILVWTALAIAWRNSPKYRTLTGFVKGALTTYITITMMVFILMIEPGSDQVGIYWWTSLFNHYLNPMFFIADFLLAERKKFHSSWAFIWLVYPTLYLVFALSWSSLTGEHIYYFLDFEEFGVLWLVLWVIILTLVFFLVGRLYTFINHAVLLKREPQTTI